MGRFRATAFPGNSARFWNFAGFLFSAWYRFLRSGIHAISRFADATFAYLFPAAKIPPFSAFSDKHRFHVWFLHLCHYLNFISRYKWAEFWFSRCSGNFVWVNFSATTAGYTTLPAWATIFCSGVPSAGGWDGISLASRFDFTFVLFFSPEVSPVHFLPSADGSHLGRCILPLAHVLCILTVVTVSGHLQIRSDFTNYTLHSYTILDTDLGLHTCYILHTFTVGRILRCSGVRSPLDFWACYIHSRFWRLID